jgi:acetyl-CoA carboxylase carboxyl transferase subunit alpha
MTAVGDTLRSMLSEMSGMGAKKLLADRRKKYLDLGSKGLAA